MVQLCRSSRGRTGKRSQTLELKVLVLVGFILGVVGYEITDSLDESRASVPNVSTYNHRAEFVKAALGAVVSELGGQLRFGGRGVSRTRDGEQQG